MTRRIVSIDELFPIPQQVLDELSVPASEQIDDEDYLPINDDPDFYSYGALRERKRASRLKTKPPSDEIEDDIPW